VTGPSTQSAEQGQRRPGRPRSAQAHQAILKAALELLAEEGYQGMSIEGVAARAGVGKTTIYRRWESKEELVLDAVASLHAEIPIIDSGNLRADLITLMQTALHSFSENPALIDLLLKMGAEIKANRQPFQLLFTRLLAPRLQNINQLIRGAQERGEIRPDIDPLLIMSMIGGSLLYHYLLLTIVSTLPPLEEQIEPVVDIVLKGLQ
jgi:AcrR family transcriptional regulator